MPSPLPPHVGKGLGLLAVTWVEAGIGLLFLAARLYTRAKIVRNAGWDDWTMIFATVSPVFLRSIVAFLTCDTGPGDCNIGHRHPDGGVRSRPARRLH
jgi:hypothetical protein